MQISSNIQIRVPEKNIHHIKEVINEIIKIPLFSTFNFAELSVISKHIIIRKLKKGDYLFKEGDYGGFVGFLIDGRVQIIKETKNGCTTLIGELSKGHPVGEMSLMDETSRSATVKIVKDSILIILTREDFEQMLDNHPKIGIKIFKALARLVSLNLRRSTGRLADFIMPAC